MVSSPALKDEEQIKHYNDLAELESRFGQAEVEVLQFKLLNPLYEERFRIIEKIPRFWPIVFDQAGDEISEYITPEDAQLLESLSNVKLERSIEEPRSFKLTLVFKENNYLKDDCLELVKEFRYIESSSEKTEDRRISNMESGNYVSQPTKLSWKENRCLTNYDKQSDVSNSFFDWFSWTGGDEEKFPDGEQLAVFIAEDLYANAVKYFTEALVEAANEEEEEESSVDLNSEEELDQDKSTKTSENQEPEPKKLRKE